MKQNVITPALLSCAKCGAQPKLEEDWDFRDMWQVVCLTPGCGRRTKECGTRHRATCRWNNAQLKQLTTYPTTTETTND